MATRNHSDLTDPPSRAVLVRIISEGFDGPCWHGPSVTSADAAAWKEDRALLRSYHERLLTILDATPEDILARRRRKEWMVGTEVVGLATHDAYHAGQIQLLTLSDRIP